MSVQTSYSRDPSAAFAGMLGDARPSVISSRANGESANVPAGIFMKQSSTEGAALLLTAATEKLAGIVLNTFARNPGDVSVTLSGTDAYATKVEMPILEEGSAWVVCEEAMAVADSVYVRFSANGAGKLVVGAIRNDSDGVAQVTTVTPGASQNTTLFTIRVSFADRDYEFTTVSDGSMSATEVCDATRVAMAADTAFTARCVASGSATLILTGQVAGEAFEVSNDGTGTITVTATTPPAVHCRKVKGARVDVAASAAGVCKIVFSLNADNASL